MHLRDLADLGAVVIAASAGRARALITESRALCCRLAGLPARALMLLTDGLELLGFRSVASPQLQAIVLAIASQSGGLPGGRVHGRGRVETEATQFELKRASCIAESYVVYK